MSRAKTSQSENDEYEEAVTQLKFIELKTLIQQHLEYIARYAQFRFRALAAHNLNLIYSTKIIPSEREVKLIITVEIPEDVIENYSKYLSIIRKLQYTARRNEQYRHKFKDIDNKVEGEKHDLSHNQDRSSRAKEDRGQTRRGSEKE